MKQPSRWNEADHLTTAARDYERFLPYSRRENDQALLAPHATLQIPFTAPPPLFYGAPYRT
jgi:hypothetical protein